jgi:hypothetical protein
MKTLTHKQLVNKLRIRKGAVILGLVAETPVDARKSGNPFGRITKRVHKTVVCGANYQRAVEKQGGENFKAEGLPYGKFVVKDKVIEASSGYQLRTVARSRRTGRPISVDYFADGEHISEAVASQYIRPRKDSSKQAQSGVNGKRQVRVQNYSFSNILEIRLDGEIYKLVP